MHFTLPPLNSQASPSDERRIDSYFGSSHQRCMILLMPSSVDLNMSKKLGMPLTGARSNFIAIRFMR